MSPVLGWIHALALVPDPDQARQWLREELSRPDYQESWVERFNRWLNDLLDSLNDAAGRVGQINPALAVVLAVVLAGLLAFALSRLRRTVALPERPPAVFGEVRRSAAEHRRAARAALDQRQWETAVVESVRALAAGLVERGMVPDQADVTVHELTENASGLYPSLGERLRAMGAVFDLTRYGDRPAGAASAREAIALEEEVSRRAPEASGAPAPVSVVPR